MKRYLPFLIIGLVAAITIVAAGMLYRAKKIAPLKLATESSSKDEKAPNSLGKESARVTLEEFGDFQCPPCAALCDPINQMQKDHRDSLRVVFRQFPLAMHAHAQEAALAAEAAGLQDRFWQMHDLLYREQGNWSNAADARSLFSSYARMLGLDMTRFEKDREGELVRARVEGDKSRGTELGVTNTPTIFVNKEAVPPSSLRPELLRKFVEHELGPNNG